MVGKCARILAVLAGMNILAIPSFAMDAGSVETLPRVPLIGEEAPASAETTLGKINFPEDTKGKWVILLTQPSDFNPVCSTEFMTLTMMLPEFDALSCKLIGLSVDSASSHVAWLQTIQEKIEYKNMKNIQVGFPVIADVKLDVARKYGMAGDTKAVRAIFFIDPKCKIRAMTYYPLNVGINSSELKRLLVGLQTADAFNVALPADWQPGDDVMLPVPGTSAVAKERVESAGKEYYCPDWFMCFKKLPREQIPPAPIKK